MFRTWFSRGPSPQATLSEPFRAELASLRAELLKALPQAATPAGRVSEPCPCASRLDNLERQLAELPDRWRHERQLLVQEWEDFHSKLSAAAERLRKAGKPRPRPAVLEDEEPDEPTEWPPSGDWGESLPAPGAPAARLPVQARLFALRHHKFNRRGTA